MQKQEIEYFVRSLRALSKAQFPDQLKERAIACQTLWLMGMMVIRPWSIDWRKAKSCI